jgi:hypothetical protein
MTQIFGNPPAIGEVSRVLQTAVRPLGHPPLAPLVVGYGRAMEMIITGRLPGSVFGLSTTRRHPRLPLTPGIALMALRACGRL